MSWLKIAALSEALALLCVRDGLSVCRVQRLTVATTPLCVPKHGERGEKSAILSITQPQKSQVPSRPQGGNTESISESGMSCRLELAYRNNTAYDVRRR